jgi:RNA polymerase sigma-70 factor (ECF subfamily)
VAVALAENTAFALLYLGRLPGRVEVVQGDFAPETWKAFRRYALEGEPAAQVAEALGLSLNAVLLAKSHVLKRLRQEVAGLVE